MPLTLEHERSNTKRKYGIRHVRIHVLALRQERDAYHPINILGSIQTTLRYQQKGGIKSTTEIYKGGGYQ